MGMSQRSFSNLAIKSHEFHIWGMNIQISCSSILGKSGDSVGFESDRTQKKSQSRASETYRSWAIQV